ncbi:phosphate starvation-inducible protein PsiE [Echinicola strongylocentroti]|uniref:histidine kinase n=1 Tax=Echinicola strongylocentroti TaxID=1795355 RepID=A0A2Z4IL64_9BACT|nr:7TM diverse intracellular signaling domain-containing protein [Echinicola strongylocentroti]AWW31685.1 phosphate starvation-inducible protein PsiE [Echinicola strongylocentroti]
MKSLFTLIGFRKPLLFVLFIAFVLGGCSDAVRQDQEKEIRVNQYALLDVNDDGLSEATVQEQLSGTEFISLGMRSDTIYIRASIKGDRIPPAGEYYLEVKSPTIRYLQILVKDGEGNYRSVGEKGTAFMTQGVSEHLNPSFTVSDIGDKEIIYKLYSVEPISFETSVYPKEVFERTESRRMLLANIYIGIMLALFLYNLVLYFSVKDRVYLVYCLYILFISLAQLSLAGYSMLFLFGKNYRFFEMSAVLFSAFSGVFAVTFIRTFLKTKRIIPKLDKVLIGIGLIYGIVFFARLFSFVELSYRLTDLAGMLVAVFFFLSAIIAAKSGYRPAIYFLIAWSFFLIAVVVFVLKNLGIEFFQDLASFPMLVGTALEAILLSLALANRINILKKEKEQQQQGKLEALKENERLVREQNVILEEKVKLRTEELEQTLKNLQNTQTQLVNQEKMASLGQLTAGIAHEINNPINFVSSNISPLKRDLQDVLEIMDAYRKKGQEEFSEEGKKSMKDIEEDLEFDYLVEEIEMLLKGMEEGAKRTVEIVKGLRLFSRVDEQDVKKVDLHDGIDSTLILLNSTMGRIEVEKHFGEIPMVECLAGKINQVFMNIISNAIQALNEQGSSNARPAITISTETVDERISIKIADNGPGMPDHVKERVFEPFFTTKAVGKGTGLGLSIVYKIIENHQGTLEVFSGEGEGTTFVITLPIYQKTPRNEQ